MTIPSNLCDVSVKVTTVEGATVDLKNVPCEEFLQKIQFCYDASLSNFYLRATREGVRVDMKFSSVDRAVEITDIFSRK